MGDWLTWLGERLVWLAIHPVVLLSVGGAAGTCARYFITTWLGAPRWARGFPVATFLINVSGSFVLGAAAAIIHQRLPPEYGYWYLLVGTGFCGGYTTFSTFEYETLQLVRDGSRLMALTYVAVSVLTGFLGVFAAVMLIDVLSSMP